MYKVFINDSSLRLVSKPHEGQLSYENPGQLKAIINELESSKENQHLVVHSSDLEKLWKDFKDLFTIIEAAGGVVKNDKDEILMIYRWEKWDLPKGKIEQGEETEQAAVREVVEECGIPEPEVIGHLKNTYHTYRINGEPILKRTYWYEMKLDHSPALTPQEEEGITRVEWCDKAAVEENIKNTYGNIEEILKERL